MKAIIMLLIVFILTPIGLFLYADRDNYSMDTEYVVTSCDYYPQHSEEGMMYNAALKMPMPHTYYYPQFWHMCGYFTIEGGSYSSCFDLELAPAKDIVGEHLSAMYGYTRFSHRLCVRLTS